MKPLKIYVAGPYSSDEFLVRCRNTKRAMYAGLKLMLKGHYPYVPHLTHYMDWVADVEFGEKMSWGQWMAVGDAFLSQCDALLFLGSSRGADIELHRAKELGLVIYMSIDEVPEAE